MVNNRTSIKFYLLSHTLSEQTLLAYNELAKEHACTIEYINFDRSQLTKTNVSNRFTEYTLYRLFIPHLLPEERVLYLDADTICDGSLGEMYYSEFGKSLYAGVVDTGINNKKKDKIRFPISSPYFNAGVLLLNLKAIKQLGIHDKWVALVNSRRYTHHDQDIINLTCQPGIVLPTIYNSSLCTSFVDNAVIHHYAGVKDPWIDNLHNKELWYKYQERYHDS